MGRFRAWRFVHPDIESAAEPAGLRISATSGIDMVEEQASVRQAILLLLTTTPGERVMRPDYGCHLNRLVFSPNDETTAGLAIHWVRQALERWEPRIVITRLDADRDEADPGRLVIVLEYRLRTGQNDRLLLSMDLRG